MKRRATWAHPEYAQRRTYVGFPFNGSPWFSAVLDIAYKVTELDEWDRFLRFDADDHEAFWMVLRGCINPSYHRYGIKRLILELKEVSHEFDPTFEYDSISCDDEDSEMDPFRLFMEAARGREHIRKDGLDWGELGPVMCFLRAKDKRATVRVMGEALAKYADRLDRKVRDVDGVLDSLLDTEHGLADAE